jgi:DNA-binding MurR/RpiR family transcriptional regulator
MTRRANPPEACEAAVRLILDAKRIQIIGFGASGFLAGLLQRGLYPYCLWVESLASPGGVSQAARQMSRVGPRDLVISIAFPRYLADTVALTRAAREAGACVMALTDTPASPLVPLARVALYAHADRQFTANADTAVMGLIEALCSAVAYQCKNAVQEATNLTESVMPWLTYGASDGDGARALRAHGQTQPRRMPRAPAPSSRKI